LNLVSNALKFSSRDGKIKITCKYINKVNELKDQAKHSHFFEKARDGLIEIQVEDEGIGIKDEDLDKLFKLFGFLNRTKEINTKGIGLGLHISKMICEQLGGDIICNSVWEKGTTFTYLIALDQMNEN
jgi:signal transduction histidine kinase